MSGLRHRGGSNAPRHERAATYGSSSYGGPQVPVFQMRSDGNGYGLDGHAELPTDTAAGYSLQGLGAEPISQPPGNEQPIQGRKTRAEDPMLPLQTHPGYNVLGRDGVDDNVGFRWRVRFDGV